MNLVKMTQNSNDLGRTESKYKTGCFDNLQFDAVNNNGFLFFPLFHKKFASQKNKACLYFLLLFKYKI